MLNLKVRPMKRTLLIAALGLGATSVFAQDFVVPVLSSSPVVQQVAVPRQVCGQAVVADGPTSGGGAVLGGLLGAGVGSQIGGGSGRGAGLAVGAIAGALIGNSIEASQRQGQTVSQCSTQTFYENRTVAYNVTYEYAGRQYTTQLSHEPGPTIRLQGSPVGAAGEPLQPQVVHAPQPALQPGPVVMAPPQPVVVAQPAVVYSAYPAPYPVYAPVYAPVYRPYYPPVSISLGFGHSRGWHHRHWR